MLFLTQFFDFQAFFIHPCRFPGARHHGINGARHAGAGMGPRIRMGGKPRGAEAPHGKRPGGSFRSGRSPRSRRGLQARTARRSGRDKGPVGAAVARSLDMGKVIGSNPILGTILLSGAFASRKLSSHAVAFAGIVSPFVITAFFSCWSEQAEFASLLRKGLASSHGAYR